jgi:zinc protease
MINFDGPKASTNEKDTFAADVLISLLNVRSGKFYKTFVDSGLALDAGLSYPTQRYAGTLTAYAVCEPEKVEEVKEKLMEEISKWASDDYFNEKQLEDVRLSLLINHKREMNSPSAFIKNLAYWWPVTGLDYYSSYIENLSKTSLKDVSEFVKTYLIKKPYVASILVSPEDAKKAGLKDTSKELTKKYLGI